MDHRVVGARLGAGAFAHGGVCVMLVSLLFGACSPGPEELGAGAHGASSGGEDVSAESAECASYGRRLCEALGPASEGCRAAVGVVGLMSSSACAAGLRDWEVTVSRMAQMRQYCDQLGQRICDAVGEDSPACRAFREDLPSIPPGHCPALLRDAPQLIARIVEREQESRPLDADVWAALSQQGGPGFGAADASVVLVAFSDFECPYCARAAETMQRVKDAYGERVRLVFRQYPLPFHPNAHAAAQASLAAFAQGKFWEYHDLLFENQRDLASESLERQAQQLGLDLSAFRRVSNDAATAEAVARDLALGERARVRGTPTLFINGTRLDNAIDYDAVAAAIDQTLGE